ncbi:hypothetical protein [Enterovirga aerilata]|uniref:Uncharacterized protein n=1 Tax=Enterovirga aerilata TaxID=2730920 RepID=A0A849ICD6_9HYPH|nr:hypothetical protein [Enterovirga sp. DB1703]NNM75068.1 hypothetical protein [Enterovirga sp. DB1703]
MGNYPDLVRAIQDRRTVVTAHCVRLDFASETKWLHNGYGPLRTRTPGAEGFVVWEGLGKLGKISDIERSLVPKSGSPSLSLSGVAPDLVAKALAAEHETKGRPARIFEQYFDPQTFELIDQPVAVYAGYMDEMSIEETGPTTATITVTLVNLLFRRRRPAGAYLSHIDQQLVHPGNMGAVQIPSYVNANPTWPGYS